MWHLITPGRRAVATPPGHFISYLYVPQVVYCLLLFITHPAGGDPPEPDVYIGLTQTWSCMSQILWEIWQFPWMMAVDHGHALQRLYLPNRVGCPEAVNP